MGIVTGWDADNHDQLMLVIEDDGGQRALLTHLLQREGYSVVCAGA